MATNEVVIATPPDTVFAVLEDPTTYPAWLPGARRIRRVDEDWPEPGTAFHHVVGAGPVEVRDATSVVAEDPDRRRLRLRARIGPFGSAAVRFAVEPTEGGTRVVMEEEPESGLVRAVWRLGGRWLLDLSTRSRNAVALDRLGRLISDER